MSKKRKTREDMFQNPGEDIVLDDSPGCFASDWYLVDSAERLKERLGIIVPEEYIKQVNEKRKEFESTYDPLSQVNDKRL